MSDKITCPKCQHAFAPSEEATKKIREELDDAYAAKSEKLEREFQARLKAEASAAQKQGYEKAEADSIRRQTDLEESLKETRERLEKAQQSELALRKQQRELEAAKAEFEILMARKLDEERGRIKDELGQQMSEEHGLRQAEWEKKRSDMELLIEDLKRKAAQGSQQAQGESFELSVEAALRDEFKHDSVEPVAKGVSGADLALRVRTRTGQPVGSILFELKRTKAFSAGWLPKLRDDQRAAKADLAVLITTTMPEGVRHIGQVDGVWVSDVASFVGLAQVLRASLIEVAQARQAQAGRKEKAEEVYDYVQGTEFRGRVQALVETFVAMKEGIETERRAYEKIWSRRDKELLRVMTATAGFYGDFAGLVGATLPEIPALSLEAR